MPLCDNKPWPGEPVIVAIPEGTARSLSLLPAKYVFDAGQKCLLGIMIRKIYVPANSEDPESREKDIAKYFVPASTIRGFIPTEYRF